MVRKFSYIVSAIVVLGLTSCNQKDEESKKSFNRQEVAEQLINANKVALTAENEQIDKLIVSNGWQMNKTGTGFRYQIVEKGNGPKAIKGDFVKIEYEVKLISGEVIYTSEKTNLKEFRIGSGGVESGLEEGILLLKVGDKARFIIPSYLAHGLSGDQDKIPPKATLIYTVKLIDLK